MITSNICHDCHLYSEGFTPEELGATGGTSTSAIHYVIDPVEEGVTHIGSCDYCGTPRTDVARVTAVLR